MRIPPLEQLFEGTEMLGLFKAVFDCEPGLIVATGQPGTGKTTTLFALAGELCNRGTPISVVMDRSGYHNMYQFPEDWKTFHSDRSDESLNRAINEAVQNRGHAILALFEGYDHLMEAVGGKRWVFAQIDTPFVGIDVAHNLRGGGLADDFISDNLRLVVSQILLPRLCGDCAERSLGDIDETRLIYPDADEAKEIWREVGCDHCQHKGLRSKCAAQDVLLIDEEVRPIFAERLRGNILKAIPRPKHIQLHEFARELVKEGMVGIETYRQQIFRNPLLRLQIGIEREQQRSSQISQMFGRYVSTEVMKTLLESPDSVKLSGEKRSVIIMITDLRGFTALSERLQPEKVVQMLNTYFEVMVDVILRFDGTINEINGDGLLVIFGAPQEMPDRAQRAVACAIAMQNAMVDVNDENQKMTLPRLEMGIGINETEVIVGNIGSSRRSKYAVVGSGVNLTSRIESYTVGRQIFISESVRRSVGEAVRIDSQLDVLSKGVETPLRIYEVGGIAGQYNLALERRDTHLAILARQIPIGYRMIEGKDTGRTGAEGSIVRLSKESAEIVFDRSVAVLTNLRMGLLDAEDELSGKDLYGKVMKCSGAGGRTGVVRFTAVPPEIAAYFHSHRQHAKTPTPERDQ